MKIIKIVLNNVGPYSGENIFELKSDKNKNIVLIGGKNGAGKTTFFTSLRACIYGYKAYGYESNNQYYYDEIYKLINDNEKTKILGTASVEMDLLFEDGMDNNVYKIVRKWSLINRKVSEEYKIYLNGSILEGEDLIDFENYILHLIPPNLFKFYFFDGEKIGEIFLQNNQDSSFKNAFLSLTGYDNIELMIKNFKRNLISKNRNLQKSEAYFAVLNNKAELSEKLRKLNEFKECLMDKKIEIEDALGVLDKDYTNNGGMSIDEWKDINKQILLEESRREEIHKLRKDFANLEVPYVILKDELQRLQMQIDKEDKLKRYVAVKEFLLEDNINTIISSIDNSSEVVKVLNKMIDERLEFSGNVILGLSNQEKNEIEYQIAKHKSFNLNEIIGTSKMIKESLKKTQALKRKLEVSNIDKYDEYVKEKNQLLSDKIKIEEQLMVAENQLAIKTEVLDAIDKELKRVKKEYEEELKALSVGDISSRALLAMSSVSEELLKTQIKKVESNFKKVFKLLINKSDFIDGIYIDEKLNIYPYKNQRYDKKFIIETMKTTKIEEYVGRRGLEIIEKHMKDKNEYIDLPQEITSPFSQGEKQVYIMAIYFALMEIGRIEMPFVIDTPFARIDKEHRTNIINNFFSKLKGQVFILSTDEEINGSYMKDIKHKVSDQYLLEYVSRGKTKVIKDLYFGG